MKRSIKRAIVTKSGSDEMSRPVQQVQYLGKTSDAEIIFPYGVHANLPEDSLLVLFNVLGQSSNQVAIGGLPDKRIQVEGGEVVFFHPLTKSKIHFKANGDIDIDSLSSNININCNTANITADSEVNITAPTTNINGDLNVSGETALSDTVTSNEVDISDTHTHVGSATAATGPVTPTGVPN